MKNRLQKKSISKMILHFRKQLKILKYWVDLVAGQLFRWLNALSTDVVVYVRKKDTHMLDRKKNACYRAFGYKRRKPSTIVHTRKNKKKEKGGVSLKENVFSRGVRFSWIADNVEHLWDMESMRSWGILSHSCRSLTSQFQDC